MVANDGMNHLRVIFDGTGSGVWNMAVDEALLHTAAETGQATLRFYTWEEPTLSLGYFQTVAEREQHSASRACPLVRRASGGGAILHDRELTYSITLPQAATAAATADLYQVAHRSLIETLMTVGISAVLYQDSAPCAVEAKSDKAEPFLCFQRRTCFDIVCQGEKIVGSAQRRRKGAVLQHGSILLARSQCAPELPGIRDLTQANLEAAELAAAWLPILSSRLNLTTREGGLREEEVQFAGKLASERFALPAYVSRR
jgi:lipoate-protein ligase A